MPIPAHADVDPIELELYRNLFEAAAEQMGIALARTSFSANIKERHDFSCALFDARGRLLAQAAHIPVHLGSMPEAVRAIVTALGELAPGQSAWVNDPFAGGTHLPDITVVTPVHFNGQLIGYAANRAHHADVGGSSPGSMTLSTSIHEEGFRILPQVLAMGDRFVAAAVDPFLAAVRAPQERLGDLRAQMAANHVGAAALSSMAARADVGTVQHYASALLEYSSRFMRQTIAAIAPGTYSFEDALDDGGSGDGPLAVRVKITVNEGRAVVDLRGSAPASTGCVNCPAAVTRSAVYYCFACLLPPGVPLNDGCFEPIEVLTTRGSMLDAQFPSAVVAGNTEASQRVVDTVLGALAKALPNTIPAASCGTMSSMAMGDPMGGWTYYETIPGGSGAAPGGDGESAVQIHMTNTLNTPAEALELGLPMRVQRFERAARTGGAGLHRGGDGVIRMIELLAPAEGTLLTDRRLSRPYGLSGGASGAAGANSIVRRDGTVQTLPGKTKFVLKTGDVIRIQTPGGGGWGAGG